MSEFGSTTGITVVVGNGFFRVNGPPRDLPITVRNTNLDPLLTQITLTISLDAGALISDIDQYLIAGTDGITFDGVNQFIPISAVDYRGFVQNEGHANIIVQNINIISQSNDASILAGSGVICWQEFQGTVTNCSSSINITGDVDGSSGSGGIIGSRSTDVQATNCHSAGSISRGSGGIFGAFCARCTATNCYSTGLIRSGPIAPDTVPRGSGGIFGMQCNDGADGSTCTATNSYSTGQIGLGDYNSGGIFGEKCNNNAINSMCIANNCFSTGSMYGDEMSGNGGIFGGSSNSGGNGCQATNCYSTGMIGMTSGGIFGELARNNCTVTNCYSVGAIGNRGGGIFGPSSNITSGSGGSTATNCYSIGAIGTGGGGVFGSFCESANATSCYTTGTIETNGGGIFGSSCGRAAAVNCYTTGAISDDAGSIYGGSASDSTAIQCYAVGENKTNNNIFAGDVDEIHQNQIHDCTSVTVWEDTSASNCLGTIAWISAASDHPYLLASYVQTMNTGVAMFGSPIGHCYQFITRTNPTTENGTSVVQIVNGSYQRALVAGESGQYSYVDNIYGYNVLTYNQITDVHPRVIILYVYLKSRARSYVY